MSVLNNLCASSLRGSDERGAARLESIHLFHITTECSVVVDKAITLSLEVLLLLPEYPYVSSYLLKLSIRVSEATTLVPGTFTALQKSGQVQDALAKDQVGQAVLNTIQNPPLLAIACILFVASTAALGWLYSEWRSNYIWLVNRLFLPIIMNAAAGLATTLINIYTARDGDWSIMALITTIITGVTLVASSSLTIQTRRFH
ncbi:hypothetical protein GB937_001324 [Aspergillus fischeri]|nr:hypothetical protein GB937_001324 [Aspergillus fischeri]